MYTILFMIGLIWSSGIEGVLHGMNKDGGLQISGDGVLDIDNGSGVGPTLVDDEDVEDISGESSGSGQLSTKTHHEFSTTTTTRSLTACEQLRLSAENTTVDAYRPKCTLNGEYEPLQCHRRMFNKECWCVDQLGNEVTGTRMMQPHVPDCITGIGLKPCVLQLLKRRQGLLGVYHPRCTIDGEFEKIQCHGSACWCVDQGGIERPETRVYQPEVPNCIHPTKRPDTVTVTKLNPTTPAPTPEPEKVTPSPKDNNVYNTKTEENEEENVSVANIVPGKGSDNNFGIHDGDVYDETGKDENKGIIGKEENEGRTDKQDSSPIVYIMGRPGLLAAVIGGAVVALLLTILLVMFIVYRMRKKDEGSYPLDEQKYTNYSYMKAPDKEFYA